jgi:hypothetical protein
LRLMRSYGAACRLDSPALWTMICPEANSRLKNTCRRRVQIVDSPCMTLGTPLVSLDLRGSRGAGQYRPSHGWSLARQQSGTFRCEANFLCHDQSIRVRPQFPADRPAGKWPFRPRPCLRHHRGCRLPPFGKFTTRSPKRMSPTKPLRRSRIFRLRSRRLLASFNPTGKRSSPSRRRSSKSSHRSKRRLSDYPTKLLG